MYRILEPGDEAALEAFLTPRLASSMFLLGNMRMSGLRDRDERAHGAYAAAFEGDQIVGVVGHYWNGNLITQSPLEHLDALWRLAVKGSGRAVHGILGPAEQAFAVQEALDVSPLQLGLAECEDLFALTLDTLIIPEPLASGAVRVRRALPADIPLLADWRTAYNVETLGVSDTPDVRRHCEDSIRRLQEAGECWVAEADGEPLAMSAFNTRTREAVQIGGVYTPPARRGRGYARAAVAQSLLDARAEGSTTAILFTGAEHLAAQRAYTAIGFRRIGDYAIILLREPVGIAQG
jgi:GNAT superfamily N-acetyltransferase